MITVLCIRRFLYSGDPDVGELFSVIALGNDSRNFAFFSDSKIEIYKKISRMKFSVTIARHSFYSLNSTLHISNSIFYILNSTMGKYFCHNNFLYNFIGYHENGHNNIFL